MKEIWVKADPWNKNLVTAALEAGADAVVVPADRVAAVKELGIIKTVSTNGDLKWEEDVVSVEIRSASDEERIVKLSKDKKVVVKTTDWTVIPLENLAARTENILVEVENREEAEIAAGILEKGVDGIIITDKNPALIKEIIDSVRSGRKKMDLVPFTVESVTPAGMGDRVCVDTCTMMKPGEGALVGNSSQALFLIHSESIENPYVSPRPFRINAGPVHAYIMGGGGRTRYLSELISGDEIVGVDREGRCFPLIVGRVKIEKRPLLLVRAVGPNGPATTIVQNAETIRFVGREGEAVSVVNIKTGDRILGYVEEAGRHFGHKIKETIMEK